MPSNLLKDNDVDTEPFGLTESAAVQISKLLLMEGETEKKFMRVAVDGGGTEGNEDEKLETEAAHGLVVVTVRFALRERERETKH